MLLDDGGWWWMMVDDGGAPCLRPVPRTSRGQDPGCIGGLRRRRPNPAAGEAIEICGFNHQKSWFNGITMGLYWDYHGIFMINRIAMVILIRFEPSKTWKKKKIEGFHGHLTVNPLGLFYVGFSMGLWVFRASKSVSYSGSNQQKWQPLVMSVSNRVGRSK